MKSKMNERLGEERLNNQGYLMKIVKYNDANNITVEFQDEYCAKVHTIYSNFVRGNVKNPYHPSVCGIGLIGDKYPSKINGKHTKEYKAWRSMIMRSQNKEYKKNHPTYEDVTVCEEWLLFTNFYEWIHSQSNFSKWANGEQWNIDKDIIKKGNKVYSPNTCFLIPNNVNKLFTNHKNARGDCPVGVTYYKKDNIYAAACNNPYSSNKYKRQYLGTYKTKESAFETYKNRKEEIIKQVAQVEFDAGNITEECYNAMMKYEIEITD